MKTAILTLRTLGLLACLAGQFSSVELHMPGVRRALQTLDTVRPVQAADPRGGSLPSP